MELFLLMGSAVIFIAAIGFALWKWGIPDFLKKDSKKGGSKKGGNSSNSDGTSSKSNLSGLPFNQAAHDGFMAKAMPGMTASEKQGFAKFGAMLYNNDGWRRDYCHKLVKYDGVRETMDVPGTEQFIKSKVSGVTKDQVSAIMEFSAKLNKSDALRRDYCHVAVDPNENSPNQVKEIHELMKHD